MSQQEKGGFHTSCQFFSFFSKLYFHDQLSPFHWQNVMITAFLASAFVCVLLQFYSQGNPDFFFLSLSLPLQIIVCVEVGRGSEWVREWVEQAQLGRRTRASLCPTQSMHKSQRNSGQRQLSPIQRDFTAALVQNFVSYRNSPKQWQSLLIRFLFPSLYYCPLLWCFVTHGREPQRRKKVARKHRSKFELRQSLESPNLKSQWSQWVTRPYAHTDTKYFNMIVYTTDTPENLQELEIYYWKH